MSGAAVVDRTKNGAPEVAVWIWASEGVRKEVRRARRWRGCKKIKALFAFLPLRLSLSFRQHPPPLTQTETTNITLGQARMRMRWRSA